MAVQTSYTENISNAREGMLATGTPCVIDAYEVQDEDGIAFGVAVHQGAAAEQVALGGEASATSPFHVTKFLGVTIRDRTRQPGDEEYKKGAQANILSQGDIWIRVGGAVTIGADVSFAEATGVLSSAAGSASQAIIPHARWLTAAASGGLAKLRLGTHTIGGA